MLSDVAPADPQPCRSKIKVILLRDQTLRCHGLMTITARDQFSPRCQSPQVLSLEDACLYK